MGPLTGLLVGSVKGKKEGPWCFLDAGWEAFKAIKKAFSTTLILAYYNPSLPSRVESDALGYALARVLT